MNIKQKKSDYIYIWQILSISALSFLYSFVKIANTTWVTFLQNFNGTKEAFNKINKFMELIVIYVVWTTYLTSW